MLQELSVKDGCDHINSPAVLLTGTELPVTGKSMNKEEFVTCGGIPLPEVDFKTMQSRLVPGLFLAGEALDIDGITGGFNFQAAWTAGQNLECPLWLR
jgi:predicted flavoprotein YhiN